jgi:hypothetical protein
LLIPADPTQPDRLGGEARFRAGLVADLDSLPVHELAGLLGELPNSQQEPLQRASDAADRHGAVSSVDPCTPVFCAGWRQIPGVNAQRA